MTTMTSFRDNPVFVGLRKGVKPKRRRTIGQWAEDEMWLSAESSAKPGPFRFGDAAYQREMMDVITDPMVDEAVFMTGSQVGKSTVLRAAMGYYIDQEPSPIMVITPTDKVASDWAQEFVDPLIRDTPILRKLFSVKDGRKQTATSKSFPGGTLTIAGANVPSNLAMKPRRILLGDEIDRFPKSAGKEGSPLVLAERRTATFKANRKMIWVSTPTAKETSTVYGLWLGSDQRRFHVKCPDCGHEQHLEFERIVYVKGKEHEAAYSCSECGSLWSEIVKRQLVREGRWIAMNPGAARVGFHLNAIYSPWASMEDIVKEREDSRGKPDAEIAFYNTTLGLPYDGSAFSVANAEDLINRREPATRGVLAGRIALLTAGVDIQRDRLEVMVWGWGPEDEGWVVDHHVIFGDPAGPRLWADLEQWLLRSYAHPIGHRLGIEAVAIDSGDGYSTQAVYDFAGNNQRLGRNWFAIKGVENGPIWTRSKQTFKNPLFKLYLVGTHDAKSNLYLRYSVQQPGPAYVHVPEWLSDGVIQQMTSEWSQTEYDDRGFSRVVWHKNKGDRNEALDMSCYAYAVHKHLDLDLGHRLRMWTQKDAVELDPAKIGALFA